GVGRRSIAGMGNLRRFVLVFGLLRTGMAQAAEDPAPAEKTEESTAESEEGSEDLGVTRGLSWDLLAGGIPSEGALIEAGVGFSGLPRVAYHRTLSPELSIGGMVTFDYAYWAPKIAFASSLLFQMPV